MNGLQSKLNYSSTQLLTLVGILSDGLNVAKVATKIDNVDAKLDTILVSHVPTGYRPGTNLRDLDHMTSLSFNTKDEQGKPTTPETELKESVMHSASSDNVIAAAGRMKPTINAFGMAGVGKTGALQGPGHDEDIKKRFGDGVNYVTFGQGETPQIAIREIKKILANTRMSVNDRDLESFACLKDPVDYAVPWFEGKICLFLVDDIWPTETCKAGFLPDIRQLLSGSPKIRMAISTRSVDIASEAGSVVDFGPRHPLGKVSVNMFMSHAIGSSAPQSSSAAVEELSPGVSKILEICGGLPIALSITGCAVSKLVRIYQSLEKACDVYAVKLENKRLFLGAKCTGYGKSLQAAIELSLEHLKLEFSELVREISIQSNSSIFDLYTSLCVLSNQAWVPVSVLGRLWKLGEIDVASLFAGMSVATLTVRRLSNELSDEPGLVLHNLQLDFCRRKAMERKKFPLWHAQLLNEYLEAPYQNVAEEQNANILERIMDCTPRPWCSNTVPEDGYTHANLSRHLSCAGRELELAALLLDARWTELRGRVGGILALKTDFQQLQRFFVQWKISRGHEATSDVEWSFEEIFKAVQVSWGRHVSGWRPFQFQVCGCLLQLKQSNEVVETYLRSVETITPKPYLVPVTPLFPDTDDAQMLEILVGGYCCCVACSPCGRYIAAGARGDIVVASSSSGEILKRMPTHTNLVTCITFRAGSDEIVFGSRDQKVMLWKWESSDIPTHVFEGHSDSVIGVAVSTDGQRIISTSEDGTVRAWDTTAGAQTWELVESNNFLCTAICPEDGKIALGLSNGPLKVLDRVTKETLFEETEAHGWSVNCVSFSPNGSYLAAGSSDKAVCVWNSQTWTSKRFKGHDQWVTSVAFNRDGNRIASSSYNGPIRLWDVESGKCVVVSTIAAEAPSLTFTADGERIVSGSRDDGIVRIWDARLCTESNELLDGHSDPVWEVALSAYGLRLASACLDGTVLLCDSVKGDHVGVQLEGPGHPVRCVSFSPDGRRAVSGSDDMTLRLWDTETHAQIGNPFEGHGCRAISGDDYGSIRIWNAETHEQIGDTLQGHNFSVVCISESSDGCHIVSRNYLGQIIIFNSDSRATIWRPANLGNEISDTEALEIIRSCGAQTPQLWPASFPEYTAELLFCEKDCVYSNLLGEKTLIGNITSATCWMYVKDGKIVAVGLGSGSIVMCKLITG